MRYTVRLLHLDRFVAIQPNAVWFIISFPSHLCHFKIWNHCIVAWIWPFIYLFNLFVIFLAPMSDIDVTVDDPQRTGIFISIILYIKYLFVAASQICLYAEQSMQLAEHKRLWFVNIYLKTAILFFFIIFQSSLQVQPILLFYRDHQHSEQTWSWQVPLHATDTIRLILLLIQIVFFFFISVFVLFDFFVEFEDVLWLLK
jgi:hypothetical protein